MTCVILTHIALSYRAPLPGRVSTQSLNDAIAGAASTLSQDECQLPDKWLTMVQEMLTQASSEASNPSPVRRPKAARRRLGKACPAPGVGTHSRFLDRLEPLPSAAPRSDNANRFQSALPSSEIRPSLKDRLDRRSVSSERLDHRSVSSERLYHRSVSSERLDHRSVSRERLDRRIYERVDRRINERCYRRSVSSDRLDRRASVNERLGHRFSSQDPLVRDQSVNVWCRDGSHQQASHSFAYAGKPTDPCLDGPSQPRLKSTIAYENSASSAAQQRPPAVNNMRDLNTCLKNRQVRPDGRNEFPINNRNLSLMNQGEAFIRNIPPLMNQPQIVRNEPLINHMPGYQATNYRGAVPSYSQGSALLSHVSPMNPNSASSQGFRFPGNAPLFSPGIRAGPAAANAQFSSGRGSVSGQAGYSLSLGELLRFSENNGNPGNFRRF
ncbi:uncharacterized protein LOC108677352 [Hyalella azteca]|uniref:Uncharacterized protein LOC108677352 n=1 Tax=Hyalella azteca TaxID=294128 RepID=A0A8B7P4K0_HYAAZ|nr:uncharacterized protein LOC108677352 [Hyalella azteca]